MPPTHSKVDTRQLVQDLRAIPATAKRELRKELVAAGRPIVASARARASWSRRIPGAIRMRSRLSGPDPGVEIRVDARRAPHARPYENAGKPGNFRHPVYGSRARWAAQRARPFLGPAVQQAAPAVFKGIDRALMTAARRHGFR